MSRRQKDEIAQKVNVDFSKKFSKLVNDRQLSNFEIAASLSVTTASVGAYLNGKSMPSAVNIMKICAILRCQYSDLLPPIPKVDIQEKTIKVIKAKVATFRI